MPLLSATNRFPFVLFLLGSLIFFSLTSPVFAESTIKPDAPAKPAGLPPVELEQAAPKSGISFKTRPLNSLNTSESFRALDKPADPPSVGKPNMEDYLATVNKHLQKQWHPPQLVGCDDQKTEPCTVTTQVTIGRNGELIGVKPLKPSTVAKLNEAVLNAINASAPFPAFPPLPATHPYTRLDLKCTFTHKQPISIQLIKASTSESPELDAAFSVYIRRLQKRIRSNWNPPDPTNNVKIVALFKLDKQGQISELKLTEPSSDPKMNLAAKNAIEKSAPFQPLPAACPYPSLDVQFIFEITQHSITPAPPNGITPKPPRKRGFQFGIPFFVL